MAVETCNWEHSEIEWIDITNPDEAEIQQISKKFKLNAYTLMDSLDPDHLPKYEEHQGVHFFIVRLISQRDKHQQTVRELSSKVAVFFNGSFIITIHRSSQPIMKKLRKKFQHEKNVSPATIAVNLLWEALHSFEIPAIHLGNEIDFYESKVFLKKNMAQDMIEGIYYLKRKSSLCKKLLLLTNEVITRVKIDDENKPALQDARDLHVKLINLYDQVQDDANNLLNIYLSLSSRKTNDVMKILTIFSVFFMPLTFIAGIYGMNFKFMPELDYQYSYPIALASMVVISLVIFVWFKRKKWL